MAVNDYRPATLTLAPGRDGTVGGVLSIGDEIAFDICDWQKIGPGQVRMRVRIDDLAYRLYLTRLVGTEV